MISKEALNSHVSILERIKQTTSGQHRRVEKLFNILDPQLTISQYNVWLESLYGYYVPFERAIEPWAEQLAIDWQQRRKAPLLKKDLEYLGVTPERIAVLPHCSQIPEFKDIASVIGAVYVFEGATLGGRFIANHLANKLNLDSNSGASFFLPYGSDPKPQWQFFQNRLLEIADSVAEEDSIIASAGAVFASFEAWLAKSCHVSK